MTLATDANTAFRDYVVDGVSASGANPPAKADIRELFTNLGARSVNVFDYMSKAQRTDVLAGTASTSISTALDISTALQAAIDSGKKVRVPAGDYKISSTVNFNALAKGLEGEGQYESRFFPTAGTNCFKIAASAAAQGGVLRDIGIYGNGSTAVGLTLGSSSANYVADWQMLKCLITGFSGANGNGIKVVCSQQFHQIDCSIYNNYYNLHRPDLNPASAGFMTVYLISGMNTRMDRAIKSSLFCPGQVGTLKMVDGTLSENGDCALAAGAPTFTSIGSTFLFERVYFEANNGNNVPAHQISITGNATANSETILRVSNCEFHPPAHTCRQFNLDHVTGLISHVTGFDPTDFGSTSATKLRFEFNGHMTNNAADFFALYRILAGTITVVDRNYSGLQFEIKNGNAFIYGTAAPVADQWSRGDVVWNTTPSAAGNAGWICTGGGTPGTWKTFAAIAA